MNVRVSLGAGSAVGARRAPAPRYVLCETLGARTIRLDRVGHPESENACDVRVLVGGGRNWGYTEQDVERLVVEPAEDRRPAGVGGSRRLKPCSPALLGEGVASGVVPSGRPGRRRPCRARRGCLCQDRPGRDGPAGSRTDRQGDRRTARLRRRPGRSRGPGARHRSPTVRRQR